MTQKPKKKIKLSSKLSKCVNYVQSVHFPGIEGYDGGACMCVHACRVVYNLVSEYTAATVYYVHLFDAH